MSRTSPLNVVVTGASSGLGAALAERYAGPGAALCLFGRNDIRLAATAGRCRAVGATAETHSVDVEDAGAMAERITAFDAASPVDIVIACAGASGGVAPGAAMEAPGVAAWQIRVNLLGALNTVEPLIPRMVERGRGRVVLVSSIAGLRGLPYSPGYSAGKAGVRAYGEALRPLLAPRGVAVTVIVPGFFDSPMSRRWRGAAPFMWDIDRAARAVQAAAERGRARLTFPWPLSLALRLADLAPPWIVDPILRAFRFHIAPPE